MNAQYLQPSYVRYSFLLTKLSVGVSFAVHLAMTKNRLFFTFTPPILYLSLSVVQTISPHTDGLQSITFRLLPQITYKPSDTCTSSPGEIYSNKCNNHTEGWNVCFYMPSSLHYRMWEIDIEVFKGLQCVRCHTLKVFVIGFLKRLPLVRQ